MRLAAQINMPVSEFWGITPYELNVMVDGYAKRLSAENEATLKNMTYQAYLISRWVWQKRVNIKKYLNQGAEKRVMTDREMLLKAKTLNAMLGGNIKKRSDQ